MLGIRLAFWTWGHGIHTSRTSIISCFCEWARNCRLRSMPRPPARDVWGGEAGFLHSRGALGSTVRAGERLTETGTTGGGRLRCLGVSALTRVYEIGGSSWIIYMPAGGLSLSWQQLGTAIAAAQVVQGGSIGTPRVRWG